ASRTAAKTPAGSGRCWPIAAETIKRPKPSEAFCNASSRRNMPQPDLRLADPVAADEAQRRARTGGEGQGWRGARLLDVPGQAPDHARWVGQREIAHSPLAVLRLAHVHAVLLGELHGMKPRPPGIDVVHQHVHLQ